MIQASERTMAEGPAGTRALSALEASSVAGAGYEFFDAIGLGNEMFGGLPTFGGPGLGWDVVTFGQDGTGGYFIWYAPLQGSWGVSLDSPADDGDS